MAKKNFYAVTVGRKIGIYESWQDCQQNIKGFRNAKYQGFAKLDDALTWYKENGGDMSALPEEYRSFFVDTLESEINPASETQTQISDDPRIQEINARLARELENLSLAKERFRKAELELHEAEERVKKTEAELAELQARLEPAKNFDVEKTTQSNVTDDFKIFCDKYGFQHLNSAQIDAVQTVNGKALLFAVPGSGKTTVLIARAGYLLYGQKDFQINADMLMNLTFTRAAAREMSERFVKLFQTGRAPDFRTIHSFCYRIISELKQRGFPIPPNVIDSDAQENFRVKHSDTDDDEINFLPPAGNRITSYDVFKEISKHFNPKLPYRDDSLREKIFSVITSIKNRRLKREDYENKFVTINQHRYSVAKIFDAYQAELKKRDCMDFDDMLIYSLQGLEMYPDLLEKIRLKYSYWSIDEAQDNSKLQNDLLSLLVGDGNLFMVGDDDQSIYNFRGSEPKLLLNYRERDDVKTMVTVINYRSGKIIVDTAKSFIENNVCRAPKKMQPRSNAPCGRINFFTEFPTESHQYRHIVKRAANCIRNGKSLAVIYRLNVSSFPVMFWLKKYGIKFNVNKNYSEIAFGKVFGTVIGLMKLATDPSDFDAYKVCRHQLKIDLNKENFYKTEQFIKNHKRIENILDWAAEVQDNLKGLVKRAKIILQEIKKLSPANATRYIIEKFIKLETSPVSRLRNYAALAACAPYDTIEEFLKAHAELLEDAKRESSDELVTLTSMHSAKGLEFDNVIIIDSWEKIMNKPFLQDEDEFGYNDDEEERRLFYVAATRAKTTLDICVVKRYFGCTEEPSYFVTELAQSYEIATNESVRPLPVKTDLEPLAKFKLSMKTVAAESQLNFQKLSAILQNVQSVSFMRSIDLPDAFNGAVLNWFNVSSLNELRGTRLMNLKAQEISYTDNQETVYHGRVDSYILVYMLVNFYKVWAPLWDLLRQERIKPSLKVLELGAGPGTSMISLIYFYQLLAVDNPDVQFKIDYDVVEREEDFLTACKSLVKSFMEKSRLPNLHLNWRTARKDIYDFADNSPDDKGYNLILESNVLNGNENLQQDKTDKLIFELADKLADKGSLILIEPGKNINVAELKRIGCLLAKYKKFLCRVNPRKIKVLVDKISLLKNVKELGLRYDKRDEHWFSYTIFGKGD